MLEPADVQAVTGAPMTFVQNKPISSGCGYTSDKWNVTVDLNSEGPVDPSVGPGTPDPAVPAPNRVNITMDRSGLYTSLAYVVAGGEGWIVFLRNNTTGSDTYPPRPGQPAQRPVTEATIRALLIRIVEVLE